MKLPLMIGLAIVPQIILLLAASPARQETNSLGITLVAIQPGAFEMGVDSTPLPASITTAPKGAGSNRPPYGDYDEVPAHKVTITKPFLIGATEVTIEQFRQFRPDYKGNSYYTPYASGISWNDAAAFCAWLSKKEGKTYRLPTEAEWEYAARAGTHTPFSSGIEPPPPDTANAWGVKNMHTGVSEWCLDWYGPYPRDAQIDPVGRAQGIARVIRGGGLDDRTAKNSGQAGQRQPAEMPYYRRSANRASMAPAFADLDNGPRENGIGFRVVQAAMPPTAPLPYEAPFFQSAIKQSPPDATHQPHSAPYFYKRELFPNLGERDMRDVGYKIGLAPGLGIAYHNSAVQVLANGDIVAAYYNTPKEEDDADQTILTMRLRYGAEDWDMPEPWPDFADAADAAPVFWNDRGKLWLFWGCPRLLGALPFQYMTSTDNGATWSPVQYPHFTGPVGYYTPQPINSIVRASDGAIYLPVDAKGGASVVFATSDNGKTWRDTGGRTGGRHTTLEIAKDGALVGWGGKNTNIDGFMPKATSRDGGKTWQLSKTPFKPLGSGQRPSIIRLASGNLFFVADWSPRKVPGPRREGAFVAISRDDGETWTQRELPGFTTVGYVTATQAPNGIIHIVTSKNKPDYHIELNEEWVVNGGPEAQLGEVSNVKSDRETYPNGKLKVSWSGGFGYNNRYLLDGVQTFYYQSGKKQWQAAFKAGRRTGTEVYWEPDGRKRWEKTWSDNGEWTWRLFDRDGHQTAESKWKGKTLLDAKL